MSTVGELRESSTRLTDDLKRAVDTINQKVDRTYEPCDFERQVVSGAKKAVAEAVQRQLIGYNSRLTKVVNQVVEGQEGRIRKIAEDVLSEILNDDEFKAGLREGFRSKLVRALVAGEDSLVVKAASTLKNDNVFRAKLTLALTNLVDDYTGGHRK